MVSRPSSHADSEDRHCSLFAVALYITVVYRDADMKDV